MATCKIQGESVKSRHEDLGIPEEPYSGVDDQYESLGQPGPESSEENRSRQSSNADANINDQHPLLQDQSEQERQELDPPSLPPSCCTVKLAIPYVILAVLLVIFIAATAVLHFIPSVPTDLQNGTQLYKNNTIFIPISKSIQSWTKWLTYFSFSINATKCEGDLYEVPCHQLKPRLSSYDFGDGLLYFIYCLNNSSFNLTWNSSLDTTDKFVDFMITTSYNIVVEYRYNLMLNCSSLEADYPQLVTCRRLTPENSSAIVVTNASSKYDGQYYFLHSRTHELASVNVHINQLYYNISDYLHPISKGRVIGQTSDAKLPLRSTFQPTNFSIVDDECFIMHVDDDHCYMYDNSPPNMLYVHAIKRGDVIFWPGLAVVVTLLVLVCAILTHVAMFYWRRKNYYWPKELKTSIK